MYSRRSPTKTWIKKPTDEERLRNIKYLSGPISWYTFNYQNVNYIFFGDAHMSKENNCESLGYQCADVDTNLNIPTGIGLPECVSLSVYLDLLFKYNNKQNIITDFFTEHPFISNELSQKNKQNNNDYMGNVFSVLSDCLQQNKQNCQYNPNVRIHYADTRRKLLENDKLIVPINIRGFDFEYDSNSVIASDINPLYYMTNVFPIVKNMIISNNSRKILQQEINDMQSIFDFIYENTFYVYKISTEELDFPQALNILIDNIPNNLQGMFLEEQLSNMLDLTSFRDNKYMFKIAVQLKSLRENGKSDIANKIILFMSKKLTYIINKFHISYQRFISQCSKYLTKDISKWNLDQKFITAYDDLIINILKLGSINIDTYLLARMFKYNDTDQVIVYAGKYHIDNYVEFFKEILSVKLNNAYSTHNLQRCIVGFIPTV